MRVREYRN